MHDRFRLSLSLIWLLGLGCTAPDPATEPARTPSADVALSDEAGGAPAADPDPTVPGGCPTVGLARCGNRLMWNGAPVQLVGYSDYEVATRDGFDRVKYLADVRPSVNLQRIWASGYSNTGRSCTGDCCPFTETLAWTVTGTHGGIPIYDLWSFAAAYTSRLAATLDEATRDGGIVELTLFDHWALLPAQFASNPWNPANNNLDAHGCRNLDGGAFPAFYRIFESDGVTLNCLGLRQKAYVERVMSVAKNYRNIMFEIMNEAGGAASDGELAAWHRAVAGWVTAHGAGFPIAASLFEVSRVGEPLTSTERKIFTTPEIGVVNLHYKEWKADDNGSSNICPALSKFGGFGRPIVIDDDGGFPARDDNNRMRNWANTALNACPGVMGAKHFNHKDAIAPTCRDSVALQKLSTLTQVP